LLLCISDFFVVTSCIWILIKVLEVLVRSKLGHPWWLDSFL
jgi:hypothetical protein